jgi:hypothetical protein
VHPTSPAKTPCSIVKSVVASVDISAASSTLHACSPSHVLGIFRHMRLVSKFGSRRLKIEMIP